MENKDVMVKNTHTLKKTKPNQQTNSKPQTNNQAGHTQRKLPTTNQTKTIEKTSQGNKFFYSLYFTIAFGVPRVH